MEKTVQAPKWAKVRFTLATVNYLSFKMARHLIINMFINCCQYSTFQFGNVKLNGVETLDTISVSNSAFDFSQARPRPRVG